MNFWTGSIVGSVFIFVVLTLIVLLDIITVKKQWEILKKNLRHCKRYKR